MDICATVENCGKDAVDECEECGNFFCKVHGNKEEHVCCKCKEKEEGGEDLAMF